MPAGSRVRVVAGSVLLVCSVVGTAGCGTPHVAPLSKPVASCRATWGALEKDLAGRDTGTGPSELPDRWAAIIAGVRYHAVSADASDCGAPLTAQRAAITALNDFEEQVQGYDMALARRQLKGAAKLWLSSAVPADSELGSTGPAVPHAKVKQAINTLRDDASRADRDLADGWAEADTVDLTNTKAVRKVVSDLDFLASQSRSYQRCIKAVEVLRRVVQQQFALLSARAKQGHTAG